MKTMTKVMTALGLVLCLGLLTAVSGRAAVSDGLTITLTPTGERGVIIDTDTIAMSGLLLGTTNYTGGVSGVVVIATGTIAPIEYTIQGSLAGGWSLSTDGYADAQNELAVHALFNATAPGRAAFEGADISKNLLGAAAQVGDLAGKYAGDQVMDDMPLNASRNLWFQLKMPPTSSLLGEQTISVVVTAEAPN